MGGLSVSLASEGFRIRGLRFRVEDLLSDGIRAEMNGNRASTLQAAACC